MKILFLIGIIIIAISMVGFGSNLTNATTFNVIGSDDNVSVSISNVDITNMVHSVSGLIVDSSTITIKNTDSISHSYRICVITKADSSISDTIGTSSDCTLTSTIPSSNTGSAVISFTNPLNKTSVDYSNISIQEIT